jgi:murein DD-endopeptidase MepM/ murein hydrolase activator NlpD
MARTDSDSSTRLTIIIRYGFTNVLYSHLGGLYVKVGDLVRAGQPIGWVGPFEELHNPPISSHGAHLHLEVRVFEQSYATLIATPGFQPETGIIATNAAGPKKPLRVVHVYEYFSNPLRVLLDECVKVSVNSELYINTPIPFAAIGKPNGSTIVLPSQQDVACFKDDGTGDVIMFSTCNQPPTGAPQ